MTNEGSKGEIPAANMPEADYKPEEDDENYESGAGAAGEEKDRASALDKSVEGKGQEQ